MNQEIKTWRDLLETVILVLCATCALAFAAAVLVVLFYIVARGIGIG